MPGENVMDWSTTAASNSSADSSIGWAEGQARASVNDSARSMMAAIAKKRNLENYSITTGGSANAQTLTSGVSYTSVPTGLIARVTLGFTNTGSTTLNMDGIGAVLIKRFAANLGGGELIAGRQADFYYNGTNWILLQTPGYLSALCPVSGTTIASSPSTVDFTGLDAHGFRSFYFDIQNVAAGTSAADLRMRFGTGVTPTWQTTNYIYRVVFTNPTSGLAGFTGSTTEGVTSSIQLALSEATEALDCRVWVSLGSGGLVAKMTSQATAAYATGYGGSVDGYYVGAITAVRFLFATGNFANQGQINCYGLRGV
jgi:hypothetical protein